jgi:hypothetical protein
MAKVDKSRPSKKAKKDIQFPLGRTNFLIIGAGVLVNIIGYITLSGNTVDGFSQLTIAPILLVIGYCIIIPVGIMYRKKEKPPVTPETAPTN